MTSISQPVSGVTTPSDPTILQEASNSNPELSIPTPNSSSTSNPPTASTFLPNSNPKYIPKEIPTTFKASLSAWMSSSKTEGAEAELHLYKKSGYFQGATLSNANNLDSFGKIYRSVSDSDVDADGQKDVKTDKRASLSSNLSKEFSNLEERENEKKRNCHSERDWTTLATSGTSLHSDGKVGIIRAVDIGRDLRSKSSGIGSWFSKSEKRFINQLEIGIPRKEGEEVEEEVRVVLHGYGAGTAFYFQNIGAMANAPSSKGLDTRTYYLDWLGMGRSARVPFNVPSSVVKQGTKERVEAAENFFIDSLEQWREKNNIKSMSLIAHSLGGYMSLSYASKYPERVDKLILVSPAGIPSHPDANPGSGEDQPSPFASKGNDRKLSTDSTSSTKDVEQELRDVQQSIAPSSSSKASDQASELVREVKKEAQVSESKAREIEKSTETKKDGQPKVDTNNPPRFSSRTRSVIGWLWEQNVSPFSILRGSLAFSPMLAGRYTSRRFGALPTEDLHALHAYCYSIFSAKGSSEYALAHILSVGAHARWPQVDRMQVLGSTKIGVYALYGSNDWMDVGGGRELVKRLKKFGNPNGKTYVVPDAGHHLYLDNPIVFNATLAEILKKPIEK